MFYSKEKASAGISKPCSVTASEAESSKKNPKDANFSTIHCQNESWPKAETTQTKEISTTKTNTKRIVFNSTSSINQSSRCCFSKFGWKALREMRPKLLTYGVRTTEDYVKLTSFVTSTTMSSAGFLYKWGESCANQPQILASSPMLTKARDEALGTPKLGKTLDRRGLPNHGSLGVF